MKVEPTTCKFITGWVVPALMRMDTNNADECAAIQADDSADSQKSNADVFSFGAQQMPSVREKVVWCVTRSMWSLTCRNLKSNKCMLQFPVDQSLTVGEFNKAKLSQYHAAVASWNENDCSKRLRIREPWL